MKKNTKFNKLNLKHFSIIEDATGEIFKPENANLLLAKQAPGLTINSKRYFIFDEQRLRCMLAGGIDNNTLGALIVLTQNILKEYNVCLNSNGEPFNAKLLAAEIKKTHQQARNYIRKLIDYGALHEGTIKKRKDLKKVLILNPYLARKGSLVDDSLRGLFDDFCS